MQATQREYDRIRELLKSYGTCYSQGITIDNASPVMLGFHKAYGIQRNDMLLFEAASNNVAAMLPFFGSERICFDDKETSNRPHALCFHKIAGHTIAISWNIDTDGYLLFVGGVGCISADIAMLVAATKDGGDLRTDLEFLAFSETPLRYGSEEREELIWSLIERQRDYSEEKDPDVFSRRADPETMVAVGLSPKSIGMIRKLLLNNIIPVCQVPFGIGGYNGILKLDFGFDEKIVPKLHWENFTHPIFPVYPGLYACPCGALLDENGCAVIGTVAQLISFFSMAGVTTALDVYERTLIGMLGIA
jgi:hypothetical protein